jgi:hypothetical protein
MITTAIFAISPQKVIHTSGVYTFSTDVLGRMRIPAASILQLIMTAACEVVIRSFGLRIIEVALPSE